MSQQHCRSRCRTMVFGMASSSQPTGMFRKSPSRCYQRHKRSRPAHSYWQCRVREKPKAQDDRLAGQGASHDTRVGGKRASALATVRRDRKTGRRCIQSFAGRCSGTHSRGCWCMLHRCETVVSSTVDGDAPPALLQTPLNSVGDVLLSGHATPLRPGLNGHSLDTPAADGQGDEAPVST